MKLKLGLAALVALATASAAMAVSTLDPHYDYQNKQGAVSNQVAELAMTAVPYPLPQIQAKGGFLELRNLRERLLRFNDANKIGYVYLVSLTGKPFGYYTIKGKISSTQSQMTVPVQGHNCCGGGTWTTPSVGDDGSFGEEEGGSQGVFFFTTTGVMIETDQPFVYSDAPLPLSVPSLNPKKAPSTVSSFWKK